MENQIKLMEIKENTITFCVGDEKEIIKLYGNGDIFVKGKLIENDKEAVDGMRQWLSECNNTSK